MLTREQILNATVDLPREEVRIPELGGSVYVREMNAGERDEWETAHEQAGLKNFRARLAAFTVCDAAGKLLFGEADVPALARLKAEPLTRIVLVAKRLNSLTAGATEDMEKNSGPARSDDSSSGSPAT